MGKYRFRILFILLTVFQTAHSIEEVITHLYDRLPVVTGALHNFTGFFPILYMPVGLFVVLNILAVGFLIVVSTFIFKGKRWAYLTGRVCAIVEVLNGLSHVSAAAYTGEYFPGAVSGLGLIVIGTILIFIYRSEFNVMFRNKAVN